MHPMKRKIAMVLLALGAVGGFSAGAFSMACHRRAHRENFEQHVARTCVEAARAAEQGRAAGPPAH
jgi:hypothetical protein